jgi:dihydrofolate reductase
MKVFVIAALSADGFIAQAEDHVADWTGTEDKKLFVQLTKEAGIMVMGSKTLATIGRALPGRRTIVYTSNPDAITIPDIETTQEAPSRLLKRLEQEGATAVAICGGASVYDQFLRAGVVDELYLTYVPQLFGSGLSLCVEPLDSKLQLLDTTPLSDGSVLCHYQVTH